MSAQEKDEQLHAIGVLLRRAVLFDGDIVPQFTDERSMREMKELMRRCYNALQPDPSTYIK